MKLEHLGVEFLSPGLLKEAQELGAGASHFHPAGFVEVNFSAARRGGKAKPAPVMLMLTTKQSAAAAERSAATVTAALEERDSALAAAMRGEFSGLSDGGSSVGEDEEHSVFSAEDEDNDEGGRDDPSGDCLPLRRLGRGPDLCAADIDYSDDDDNADSAAPRVNLRRLRRSNTPPATIPRTRSSGPRQSSSLSGCVEDEPRETRSPWGSAGPHLIIVRRFSRLSCALRLCAYRNACAHAGASFDAGKLAP